MKATVRTEPAADVAYVVQFSDQAGHDTQNVVQADAQGVAELIIPLKPTVPTGDAGLLIAAGKDRQGATAEHPFTVAKPGGC